MGDHTLFCYGKYLPSFMYKPAIPPITIQTKIYTYLVLTNPQEP